ncbi:MAG: globin [Xanthomarina sp.]|jgi:hemoglobin|uniref:Hemoglobin n=3 Tax=Xanthomarina gelatinilytica TaxID=1137281 RepID=M7MX08_9FLAO|nr:MULTISPECIES: group III truncated hemoglobin [Xanthomarina]EMQ94029.1 hemoglobin [Xanthomarina gelatinilytica]MAL22030.1 globin [Xanthomarina sp.]MBF62036.1 globin [Xanthomarina sp.]MDX1317865.1 group III truncated hemoglobin [Xanthomarina gelatinilytica]|tara:strand:+ start:131 stop:529 length:399 start_codon:yes stop_codon:yes gene_type:complete
MTKKDIETHEDVHLLVSSFYAKIRKDTFLGPFFNRVITDWEAHIDTLTTFWETSLFTTRKLERKYYGNPLAVHVKVDQENNQSITQEHFGNWLNLWFETIDEHFEGEYALKAKQKARKMSTFLYLNIFQSRQ